MHGSGGALWFLYLYRGRLEEEEEGEGDSYRAHLRMYYF
jgi:hypothetical protein